MGELRQDASIVEDTADDLQHAIQEYPFGRAFADISSRHRVATRRRVSDEEGWDLDIVHCDEDDGSLTVGTDDESSGLFSDLGGPS
jgi:hypothetical protein